MRDSSSQSDRPLYLYIVLLGNLIATGGMTFLLLGVLGALGLITAVTDTLGGLGSSFASATTGSAIEYSFAFLAGLVSLAASWKMFREGPRLWLLVLVVVFQLATAAVFHSWVSVIALIPTLAALYGLVLLLVSGPVTTSEEKTATGAEPVATGAAPVAPTLPSEASIPASETSRQKDVVTPPRVRPTEPAPVMTEPLVRPAPQSDARPPAPPASRRCADCGSLNSEDARFCNSCGSILPG